jgi:hypothetical protein
MFETWLMVPLSALYGGSLTLALTEWVRNPRTRYLSRWAWLPIIVIFSLVGPMAYLLFGKEPAGKQELDATSA